MRSPSWISPVGLVSLSLLACGACVDAVPAPVVPTVASATVPPAPAPFPLAVSDELARFGTAVKIGDAVEGKRAVSGMAADPTGPFYLAFAGGPGGTGGTLTSYAPNATPRWSVPLDLDARELLPLGGDRVLALGAGASTKTHEIALAWIEGGVVRKTVALSALVGRSCSLGRTPSLSFDRGAPSVLVACSVPKVEWIQVRLEEGLSAASAVPNPGYFRAPDGADWDLPRGGSPRELRVSRSQVGTSTTVQQLGTTTDAKGSSIGTTLAFLPSGDGLLGATLTSELVRTNGGATMRYANRTFVARIGAGHAWTTTIADVASTDEPIRMGDVVNPGDGTVLLPFDHGPSSQVGTMGIPHLGAPGDPFATTVHQVAVADLDAETGAVRGILVLRPSTTPPWQAYPRIAANKDVILVRRDNEVTVHARTGKSIAPVPPAIAPAIPTFDPIVPAADAAGSALVESWSELCGPRWATKGNGPCRVESTDVGKDGTVVVGGGYYLENQLGARKLRRAAYQTGILAAYERDGTPRFVRTFGVSWHNGLTQVLARDDGSIVALGTHGQGFSVDGKTLPPRKVPVIAGQDMGFEANTPFVAVFDRNGRIVSLDDVDTMITGHPVDDYRRRCWTTMVHGVGDVLEAISSCGDGAEVPLAESDPERGTFRWSFRGTSASNVTKVPRSVNVGLTLLGDGTMIGDPIAGARIRLAGFFHGEPKTLAFDFGHPSFARGKILFGVSNIDDWSTKESMQTLAVSVIADDLSRADARLLGRGRDVRLDGVATDEQGRLHVTMHYAQPFDLGGRTLSPEAHPEVATPSGRALVRLSQDGTRIERVWVLKAKEGGCSLPQYGIVSSLAVRGGVAAMTFSGGAAPRCKIGDESSSIMTFAVP